jgi:pyruvate dehydrogenase (quinone)
MATIATQIITALVRNGVRRVYGLPGDSLNGFTDAIRRNDDVSSLRPRTPR